MENPRFVKGELETHFIERETTLLNDIQAIIEREEPLDKKLAHVGRDKRKIAAIAAVTAITQAYSQRRSNP
jgi:pyruvate carboxylase subunit A